VVLGEELAVALERQVEPAEGRAAIAGDEGGGAQAATAIGAMLLEGEADQRLDAGQEDDALFLRVLGIQRERVGSGGHGSP
jgi:hypothetical protein